jgi:hypothetical protein
MKSKSEMVCQNELMTKTCGSWNSGKTKFVLLLTILGTSVNGVSGVKCSTCKNSFRQTAARDSFTDVKYRRKGDLKLMLVQEDWIDLLRIVGQWWDFADKVNKFEVSDTVHLLW